MTIPSTCPQTAGSALRQASFEDTVCKEILAAGAQLYRLPEFRQQARTATGTDDLTLAGFRQLFPDFPVQLAAADLQTIAIPTLADLDGRFTSTVVFQQYESRVRSGMADQNAATGLVFPFLREHHGVLHNFVHPPLGTQTTKTIRGVPYFIETLCSLLTGIGPAWSNPRRRRRRRRTWKMGEWEEANIAGNRQDRVVHEPQREPELSEDDQLFLDMSLGRGPDS